ncbi:MAG TPA: hypothetical protein VGF59_00060 [Bryobacteraceae bacterium]|jgi:hypothetical protein
MSRKNGDPDSERWQRMMAMQVRLSRTAVVDRWRIAVTNPPRSLPTAIDVRLDGRP